MFRSSNQGLPFSDWGHASGDPVVPCFWRSTRGCSATGPILMAIQWPHASGEVALRWPHACGHRHLRTTAGYSSIPSDVVTLSKLIRDLGWLGRFYVKSYRGVPYVILKGNQNLRTILTGTRYRLDNAKVVQLALGPRNLAKSSLKGSAFTLVALAGVDVLDVFIRDDATISQLAGTLTSDGLKVGLSTLAGIGAASLAAGITTIAAGPLVAAILVTIGVGMALDHIDESVGATKALIGLFEALGEDLKETWDTITTWDERAAREISRWEQYLINQAMQGVR
jgi:hypothetical protein